MVAMDYRSLARMEWLEFSLQCYRLWGDKWVTVPYVEYRLILKRGNRLHVGTVGRIQHEKLREWQRRNGSEHTVCKSPLGLAEGRKGKSRVRKSGSLDTQKEPPGREGEEPGC